MAQPAITEQSAPRRKWLGTRIFSIAALCSAVCGVGYVAKAVYYVATDAFVAPVVLSPDSDLVIQSKLSRAALMGERMRSAVKKDQIDAELEAAERAIKELEALLASASRSLDWTSAVTATLATAGTGDLRALRDQQSELTSMIAAQE